MPTIVQDGDSVLRKVAEPIQKELFGSDELREMLGDMETALNAQPDGVALAAPQIGISRRIFIVRYDRLVSPPEDGSVPVPDVGVYINPEIEKVSKRKAEMDEGCLSVRGWYGKADRHERATVRAQDAQGKTFTRGAGGVLAQAFQHEIDHLNGILFIDHAHDLKKYERRAHKPFVYFGTPYVASRTLELLSRRGFYPSLIVTSPDAPKGRGLELTPSPTKVWGESHDIPVFSPEKLDGAALEKIQDMNAEYAVVVAYGKILPKSFLASFPLGVLNIHYSLLPKYRGASPVESALLHDETETGVTIQKMVEKVDAGDIIAQKKVSIEPEETTRELRGRLIRMGAFLLADILPLFEAGVVTPEPQDESKATFCGKTAKEDGRLDLAGDAKKNWNTYRAYAENPGTFFFIERKGKRIRVKIKTATFENGAFVPLRIVPEGKKEMEYAVYMK